MVSSSVAITGSYNYVLVACSLLTGMFASWAPRDPSARIAAARGGSPRIGFPVSSCGPFSAVVLFLATRKEMGFVPSLTGRCVPYARFGGGHLEPDGI
jgi:hypothetical protein